MQTFLPTPEFNDTAKLLDRERLNKQILEASQIMVNITRPYELRDRWKHHPAVKMWEGYEVALSYYMQALIDEWRKRGYETWSITERELGEYLEKEFIAPYWIGDSLFHSSHRSNLLYKDKFYWKNEWEELNAPYLCYVWPSFYSDFQNKILTKKGVKSLIKALKRRDLWKEDYFRWPGSNEELGIVINTGKLI